MQRQQAMSWERSEPNGCLVPAVDISKMWSLVPAVLRINISGASSAARTWMPENVLDVGVAVAPRRPILDV